MTENEARESFSAALVLLKAFHSGTMDELRLEVDPARVATALAALFLSHLGDDAADYIERKSFALAVYDLESA
jgi:hypothetical protein